jgi:hypothetical protein
VECVLVVGAAAAVSSAILTYAQVARQRRSSSGKQPSSPSIVSPGQNSQPNAFATWWHYILHWLATGAYLGIVGWLLTYPGTAALTHGIVQKGTWQAAMIVTGPPVLWTVSIGTVMRSTVNTR